MEDLLVHPIFDEEFRNSFDEKMKQMQDEDELQIQELMKVELKTKDGRTELSPEELVTEDENKDDDQEIDDDDDDSSSAVCTPGTSDDSPDGSSSGIDAHNNVRPLYHRDENGVSGGGGPHDTPSTVQPPKAGATDG